MTVSPQSRRILGYAPEDLRDYAAWHAIIDPDDLPGCIAGWDSPSGTWDVEYRARHADGHQVWLSDHGRKEFGADGQPTAAFSAIVDITARHALENQLRQAQRLEAVGQLAGGIAHDMNNILSAITGYGGFARAALDPGSPAREDIEQVLLAAERATALTRQLLAVSRRQPLQARHVDVGALIDELVPMLRRLLGEHITVTVHRETTCAVLADPSQIEQVVLNLVINARDAMADGGSLEISTRDIPDDEAPDEGPEARWTRLEVADTGAGMDAATLERVFEPFFTTKPQGTGTGLGLATVHGIVTGRGGRIAVASEPGVGTRFTIDLPCARVDAAPVTAQPEPAAADPGHETVLVVEDEPAVRAVLVRTLERLGYRVIAAAGGAEALRVATGTNPIDLLLTDVRMPGMQGPEVALRLRERRPGLPVLFLTGFAADHLEGHALGNVRVLAKPLGSAELGHAIRAAIDEARAAGV